MKKRKAISYYLGNFFIVCSLISIVYILYPIISIYFFPPQLQPVRELSLQEGMSITIPKLSAQSPIIANVNPWNEHEYMQALKKGVAHARGTALPGDGGMTFLFAHSSGAPWDMTHENTIFLRLGELKKGDEIIITRDKMIYKYFVRETKVVFPTEVSYLLDTKRQQLIIQTCTPIGTSYKRLLVFADPRN